MRISHATTPNDHTSLAVLNVPALFWESEQDAHFLPALRGVSIGSGCGHGHFSHALRAVLHALATEDHGAAKKEAQSSIAYLLQLEQSFSRDRSHLIIRRRRVRHKIHQAFLLSILHQASLLPILHQASLLPILLRVSLSYYVAPSYIPILTDRSCVRKQFRAARSQCATPDCYSRDELSMFVEFSMESIPTMRDYHG